MQGYMPDLVEELYYANDIYVTPNSRSGRAQRQAHRREAMATLKLLSRVAQVSMEQHDPAQAVPADQFAVPEYAEPAWRVDHQRSETAEQRKTEAGISRSGISTRIGCSSGYGIVWAVVASLPRQQSE